MEAKLTEDYLVEQSAINWLKEIGYLYIEGSALSPECGERESYRQVVLKNRFVRAIKRINPWLDDELAKDVYKKIIELEHPDFVIKSKLFYEMLVNGVKITIKDGRVERTKIAKIIDYENPENNEFLVANQFTVEYQYQRNLTRRPDMVVFINGIPIAVFEFKSFNANETAKDAFYDHKEKMKDIPQLYIYAQFVVASDGVETKYGSPMSDWERFFVWEGIDDDNDLEVLSSEEGISYSFIHKKTNARYTSLEVFIKGLMQKERLLEYIEDFIFYEKSGESFTKKIAMFHQFYSVRKAIKKTIECVTKGSKPEERRIGVIWHTQGSGKSLTMYFYARKALKSKELQNPIILFVTDRNELDDQLYKIFSHMPIAKQAESINDLQETIKTIAGGIIFTTIQKFGKRNNEEYPFLTERRNIIVIADEAHRSQYRELAMNLRKAIPNASFMGFTATPIEFEDRDTYLVFGEPISIYSMDKARRHNVVVPIYYEARLAELHLMNEVIDEEFEEITEDVIRDPEVKENIKRKFAKLEEIMLAEERIKKVAKDIVEHFNKRRNEIEGKGLVVAISRKVAVKLYNEIIKQPDAPSTILVMSGNKQKDPEEYHPHIRNKIELEEVANNFKNPEKDPVLAIVVDMWLTGFDVPCLHTIYFDKPMKGYSLMQAIARVNRVFKDKPGGLIVDYIGIADDLRKSLGIYAFERVDEILSDITTVVNELKEKHNIVCSIFHGIDFKNWNKLSSEELSKLTVICYERVTKDEETKKMFIKNFVALKKLYALASPHPEAYKIKDDIKFFEMIKKMIIKYQTASVREISRDLEYEMSQLISKSISAEEPVDVFSLMEKEKPEISILNEDFLLQFKNMQYKNYAAQLLAKLLKDKITYKYKKNPFRYRTFYEMLNGVIEKYNKKLITAAEIIDLLIEIAKDFKKAVENGMELDLSEEELAFYDLLCKEGEIFANSEEIKRIAKQIVKELGYYVNIVDWNKKDNIKAKIKKTLKAMLIRSELNLSNVSYKKIESIVEEVVDHAEKIYGIAA